MQTHTAYGHQLKKVQFCLICCHLSSSCAYRGKWISLTMSLRFYLYMTKRSGNSFIQRHPAVWAWAKFMSLCSSTCYWAPANKQTKHQECNSVTFEILTLYSGPAKTYFASVWCVSGQPIFKVTNELISELILCVKKRIHMWADWWVQQYEQLLLCETENCKWLTWYLICQHKQVTTSCFWETTMTAWRENGNRLNEEPSVWCVEWRRTVLIK